MGFSRPSIGLHDTDTKFQNILDVVEFNARHNGEHCFCLQTYKTSDDRGFHFLPITFGTLRDVVISCAQVLRDALHDNAENSVPSTVAILMESDVNVYIHMLALMTIGAPVFLLSHRLSPTAISHLVQATDTKAIIASPGLTDRAQKAVATLQHSDQPKLVLPTTIQDLLSGSIRHDPPPLRAHAASDPQKALILHTSGTTGLPKPIIHPAGYFLGCMTCHELTEDATPQTCLSTLPLCHGFGLIGPSLSLGIGMTLCLPAPSMISNANTILELLNSSKSCALIIAPSLLEEFVTNTGDAQQTLNRLEFVAFGGGRLRESCGNTLVCEWGVKLLNHYGSTETGGLSPMYIPDEHYDWRCFRLREDIHTTLTAMTEQTQAGREFRLAVRPIGWDETFELQDQIVLSPNDSGRDFIVASRNDAVLVLSNGEKVDPTWLEGKVADIPQVRAAIAFGDAHTEIGTIVQPDDSVSVEQLGAFRSKLWNTMEKLNRSLDGQAQLTSKNSILMIPSTVALPRTTKGSIRRRAVYEMFEDEIDQFYENLETSDTCETLIRLDSDDLERDIQRFIQEHVQLPARLEDSPTHHDLFDLGLDSLQAVKLRRLLLSSLHNQSGTDNTCESLKCPDFIYQHSSVKKIAAALRGTTKQPDEDNFTREALESLVSAHSLAPLAPNPVHKAVLLLGATGAMGANLLAQFAEDPQISSVVCLNRPVHRISPLARQRDALKTKGLHLSRSAWQKVQVYECNTDLPALGLTEAVHASLVSTVSHMIHASWPIDFKRHVSSFGSSFKTLQNLLLLGREIHHQRNNVRPRLLFVSSIATVGKYASAVVPEIPMPEPSCALNIGYAHAKLVCEAMIEKAAVTMSDEISVCYARVGQLSGNSSTGQWNQHEHIPALLRGSQMIGALPKLEGTLSWIPTDIAARALYDITLSDSNHVTLHVENPVRQSWSDMLSLFAPAIGVHHATIPFEEWLRRIREEDSAKNPAVALLSFFEEDFERMACGAVVLDTTATRQVSPALRQLGALPDEMVSRYIDAWRSCGFLE